MQDGTTRTTRRLPPRAALRWAVVEQALDAVGPGRLLEIGCGRGAFGARLAARGDYTGLEPDPTSRREAVRAVAPRGGVVVDQDDRWAVGREPWDVVCAFEVLEHLEDDAAALRRWHDLVAPGGHLLLSVPAGSHRMGAWDGLAGHYRRYDAPHLESLLAAAGFGPVRTSHYGWPLDYGLEAVRNAVGRRRRPAGGGDETPEERTEGSGRILQPGRVVGALVAVGVRPFVVAQRRRTDRGTGLVALARRPHR